MKKNTNCMQTIYACFIGYIVQAIVNNFVPLLFVTFRNNYHISLERITFLITLNFIIQLFVDLLSAFFIDRIGYRISILIAHILSAAGLILLTVLPEVFSLPLYRTCNRSYHLCDRRWTSRSTGKPDHRSLPY